MPCFIIAIALGFAVSSAAGTVDPAGDPKRWLDALDHVSAASDGWAVENLRVELGPARLEIEKGTLVPVRGPAPRPQEFLFFGKARFVLVPDDPVESYQLELFTQRDRLDEPVTRAVLAIASDEVADSLSTRPGSAPLTIEQSRQAAELLATWRASREYRRSGLRLQALADAIGDPVAQRFAAAWCDAPRLGRFLHRVDPDADESSTVEQFVPLRLGDLDKEAWRHWLRREQFEGRHLDRDPDDYGNWDIWFAGGLRSGGGQRIVGHSAFEPEHYDLEVSVDDDIASMQGRAAIDLVGRTEGARVIQLSLFPDLAVESIALRGGPSLPWARSTGSIVAVLPAPVGPHAKLSVEVRYRGVLFERNESNLVVKRTTTDWYPRVGSVDRATYRAAFEIPSRWSLLGSGRRIDDSPTGDRRRQVRELDKPTAFFGFELGKFKVVERTLGHIALTIGFLTDLRTASESEREATIATIRDALATYEERFGPYPLDTLCVATTRHEFAQGFLSFVTLPDDVVQDVENANATALEQRRIIAHELAHQWWGNLVGWASDRDVWLSESLANYSAAFFRRKTAQGTELAGSSAFLDLIATADILPDTIVGRPVEAMGPITLGSRLDSSLSDAAYHAIVYQKGAKVLAMLAEQLGEDQFLAMLKEIAQRAHFRPIDTETMLAALAKMSGRSLDEFSRSFVHGVGYPEIHYDYVIEPTGAEFALRGTVHQVARGFRRDRLIRAGVNGFDVAVAFHEYQSSSDSRAIIPGVVSVGESVGEDPRDPTGLAGVLLKSTSVHGFKAIVDASGPDTPFVLKVPEKPQALHLDPRTMMPTTAINATLEPKESLTRWAAALRSTGRAEEARVAYGRALALNADVNSGEAPETRKRDVVRKTDILNGWIHLQLAELALDDGRIDEAVTELDDRTAAIVTGAGTEGAFRRKVLRARLALHAGDAATAYKLLNGVLALDVLQKETDTGIDAIHKNKLNSGWSGYSRDYLVYAAAAHATGHEDVCREAAEEAKRRGGDASVLDELHAGVH